MQIYWNKIKRLHKKGVWLPADWFWDTNMASVSLFWDTNMTAVTSCKNTLYHSEENGKGFFKSFFAKPASQLWSLFFIILFCYFCGFMNSLASYIDLLYFVSVAHMPLINRQWGHSWRKSQTETSLIYWPSDQRQGLRFPSMTELTSLINYLLYGLFSAIIKMNTIKILAPYVFCIQFTCKGLYLSERAGIFLVLAKIFPACWEVGRLLQSF